MSDDKQPQDGGSGSPWIKSLLIWTGIILVMLMIASALGGGTGAAASLFPKNVQYSV